MKNKLRELVRKYIKFDGSMDEEQFITEILSLAKECAPGEKKIIELDEDCTSTGNADDAYDHGMERGEVFGFNFCRQQFLANIEGEECIK